MKKNEIRVKRLLMFSLLTGFVLLPGYSMRFNVSAMHNNVVVDENLPTKKVTGVVTDKMGAVIGANVSVKGTTIGTITDFDGKFALDVPEGGILVVSFIGYIPQEIPLKGQNEFNVLLKEDTEVLDEVVVVGYGKAKRITLTGAVSGIQAREIRNVPTSSVQNALTGKLPGFF